ncbi:hypothetical protein MVEG_12354 [Podila verticillata NRRL 6337]|uniref:Uncharacterized protein n=1 Tax=Podila verticillata NRRL 6337 TaxID=1069443 RepID=A0A086TIR9_9FUNG|nr:hypothetical protein MVEG_12354 [Podila verticillata NRRL 6337]
MPSLATSTNMLLDCTTDAKSRLSELSSATPAIHLINDPFPFVAPKQHQLDYIHQQQRIHQQQQRLLLYTQERCRLQYLRFSNQHSLHNQSTVNVAKQRVDLVDDIWRLVTYILASDCKGLGRLMQVNRRLHELTVSGSIFSSQKPLLSPAWIREEHGRAGSELYGSLGGLGATSSKHRHSSGSVVHGQEKVDIHEGDDTCSKGLHLQDLQQHHFTVPAPGLQLPSQLVLPHHRRIVSAFTSHTGPTGATVTPTSSATSLHHLYNPGPPVGYSSPQSTVSACASSSFHSMSEGVSQVLSNSTIPLTVVQQLVPSTTLKHHSPAVYWKHQVVEWLEQEKLRCLRLGLFWGFSLGSNRTHGHKLSW